MKHGMLSTMNKKSIRRLQNKPKNEEPIFRHHWKGSSMLSKIAGDSLSHIRQAQDIIVIEGRCLVSEEVPDYPCYDIPRIMHVTETCRYVEKNDSED